MTQLIYHSLINQDCTTKDIKEIFTIALDCNVKFNITGCLLFHKGEFLQLLEGERQCIEQLYDNIKKDVRHRNVNLIYLEDCEQRNFENWTMAIADIVSESLQVTSRTITIDTFSAFLANNSKDKTSGFRLFRYVSNQIIEYPFHNLDSNVIEI
jgi:hypothetical protein